MSMRQGSRAAETIEHLRSLQSEADRSRLATMELVRFKRLKTSRDRKLQAALKSLLDNLTMKFDPALKGDENNRIEARALLVLGETGAGKSWTLRRHFSEHPAFVNYGKRNANCPLITVNVKPPMTFLALGKRVAAETGYPIEGRLEAHASWDRVYQRLEDRGICGIHFDELHNFVRTANEKYLTDNQNMLKSLMTNLHWPVFVICSGLPVLKEFVEPACEDRRRLRTVHFARLSSPDDNAKIKAMLKEVAVVAALRLEEHTVHDVVPRLMHAALYALGRTMEMMHEAIDDAFIRGSSELTNEAFSNAYVARTDSLPDADPFKAPNWSALDCSKILMMDANASVIGKSAPANADPA